jgi:cobalamin biosynthesis protein CobT
LRLDFHAALQGVSEAVGDKLIAEMDKTEKELNDVLSSEILLLRKWKLEGKRPPGEIYERWEALREKIAVIREKGVKAALKTFKDDAAVIMRAASSVQN